MGLAFLRWSAPFLAAVSAAACGATGEPPATPTTTLTGSPSANVHATGKLAFTCSADGGCSYQGLVTNDGPDCASNVRGVTHLFDASGKEIASQAWKILGRLRRGDASYEGCCFSQAAVDAYSSYRTDVAFDALLCV
jgi:hypothetical protein